jgi:nucleoside-diphosphate-sugar epimerase
LPKRIAVSGATGWLGRETIEKFSQSLPLENLILYSSDGRGTVNNKGASLPTENFLSAEPPNSLEGFIHLAFLTRDKVPTIGFAEFVSKNMSLISKACQIIETSKPKWVVLVSSGAILDRNSGEEETDIMKNPYGFCKRIEEALVLQSAQKVGANVVIGRLWGATGEFMPHNSAYAISDFIQSAHTKKRIDIKSGGSVIRRYVDAGEFMEVLVKAAANGESITINSGGAKIEISKLAELVVEHFPNIEIVRPVQDNSLDDYFPRDSDFEILAASVGVLLSDLQTQVSRTVKGHVTAFCD